MISLPPATDILALIWHGGTVPTPEEAPATRFDPTLASLRDRYLETHGNGTLEPQTLRGINRHFRHLVLVLGEGFPVRKLSLSDLQGYIDKRAEAKGRRGTLNPRTIKKEIATLRTAWNWGVSMKIVAGRYPYDGLRYPKNDDKPPLQTMAEIQRQIPSLPPAKADELWEALYLSPAEIGQMLADVKEHAAHPWIYPLVATAAHTDARKGELPRLRIGDVDFASGVVSINERKRAPDDAPRAVVILSGGNSEGLASGPPRRRFPLHPGRNGGTEQEADPDDRASMKRPAGEG